MDPRNLLPVYEILNSEGRILGLNKDSKGNLYLSSSLNNGLGEIFYATTPSQLKAFIESKITINEIYSKSKDFLVKFKFRKEVKTYLKEDFIGFLVCGADYYKNLPESMKSKEFEEQFGR